MDVRKLNLVNRNTRVQPNYDISKSETSIRLYFNRNGEVLIIGQVDNNYIYWASFTKIADKEVNKAVFTYIGDESPQVGMVSNESTVLASVHFSYDALDTWYRTELWRASEYNMAWRTPFGHYYGKQELELTAGYFARDLSIHLDDLLERCRFREAGGAYEAVLDYCLEELKRDGEDVYHYVQVEELIGILQQEHYLILSEREQIREKYFLFRKEAGRLYNQYQTAIR